MGWDEMAMKDCLIPLASGLVRCCEVKSGDNACDGGAL